MPRDPERSDSQRESELDYDRLGRHWDRELEVDLVAVKGRSPVLAGECKWSRKPVGEDVLDGLRHKAPRLAGSGPPPLLALFPRAGFTPAVTRQQRVGELAMVDVRCVAKAGIARTSPLRSGARMATLAELVPAGTRGEAARRWTWESSSSTISRSRPSRSFRCTCGRSTGTPACRSPSTAV
ncbi:MAG: hypothetical protein HY705_10485 [Gemmatimonadetes bacterium]|nr:hypothetical protein [Gemmatimonadota bacterium]